MKRPITPGRKFAYYFGMILMLVGVLTFVSTFFLLANGADAHRVSQAPGMGEFMKRALGGMGLIVVGAILRGIGAVGLAGSGVVLDPERAREEWEPHTRMVGGMVRDALDEADIDLSGRRRPAGSVTEEKEIMIRCRSCRQLNEEDSKFCQECGRPI